MLVLLVLTVTLVGATLGEECDCRSHWSPLHLQAHGHEARLNRLGHRIDELRDKMNAGAESISGYKEQFDRLDARIHELQDHPCHEGEFQCGGDTPKCISDLLVCDGSNDCDDGSDECHNTCHNLLVAGSSWHAHLDSNRDFCTQRKPHHMELLVTSVRRSNQFQARLKVKGQLKITHSDNSHDSTDMLEVSGYYNFASKTITLGAPETDGLGLVCVFKGGHEDRCEANIVHEATGKSCLHFHFNKH